MSKVAGIVKISVKGCFQLLWGLFAISQNNHTPTKTTQNTRGCSENEHPQKIYGRGSQETGENTKIKSNPRATPLNSPHECFQTAANEKSNSHISPLGKN